MEITINLRGLDVLANALVQLASAMGVNSTPPATQQPLAAFVPPPSSPAPIAPPVAVAPPPVPTTAAPTYTHEQLMLAGAHLATAGKSTELVNLLTAFGVLGVAQLKQEQLGAFATEMRKLGAQI